MPIPSVRKVAAAELGRVAAVLARAFVDDPAAGWVFPDGARRRAQLERAYHLYLRRIWFRHGECYTTPAFGGAAIWLPPGAWEVPLPRQLLLLPQMALELGASVGRVLRAVTALESQHPHRPHWYLAFVGVDPDHQRQGIGHALLKPMLARCDRENLPAYLEASSPRNRPLYEGLGFEVTGEFTFGPGAPPLWRMWRTPLSKA